MKPIWHVIFNYILYKYYFMSKSENNKLGSVNENQNVDKIPQKSRKKGKTPKELMTRHIADEKDVITEDEFKNLDLETEVKDEIAQKEVKEQIEIQNDPDRAHDEDKDHSINTPWDVIK